MWMGPLTGRCHCGGAGGAAACWHSSTGRGKCHASVLCRLCVRIGIQDDGLASDSRGHHCQRSRCQTFPQKLVGIRNKNTNAIMSAENLGSDWSVGLLRQRLDVRVFRT